MARGGPVVLIGREPEVVEVVDRLGAHRLVTVTGPGGMGKTSVAVEVAARLGGAGAGDPGTVDLTVVDDPAAVSGTVAAQLGAPSFRALLDSLADQVAFVLVDNCEHVIDTAGDAVAELLDACPGVTVLATSRSPLGLAEESVFVLGPLPTPPASLASSDAPAVQLFLARARDAGAVLHDDDLPTVAALCQALDGIPLAIEIAAARTRSLTPHEVHAALGDLDTLTRTRFRGTERHRSLRAAIAWSHALLEPDDRELFDRLAVLAGSFELDTAHAVASDDATPAATALRLERLVDASLLLAERIADRTRYRQLDALRSFAREQLDARDGWDPVWERFVDHVLSWSIGLVAASIERWDAGVLRSLLTRTESHLAALRWCAANDDDPGRSLLLLATLWGVVHQGRAEEVAVVAEQVLGRWPDRAVPGWSDAAATAATCRYLLGDPAGAMALAEEALPHADRAAFAPCTLRRVRAQARAAVGDVSGALAALDEAIPIARARVPALAMELEVFRAEVGAHVGDVDAGLAAVRDCHGRAVASGSHLNAVWARCTEASLLLRTAPDAAVDVARQALDEARSLGYPSCAWVSLHTLAVAAIERGAHQEAATLLGELLEDLAGAGAENEARNAVRTAAVLLHRLGRPSWQDLARSAVELPSVSVFAIPGHERLALPEPPPGAVLGRGELLRLARLELAALQDGAPAPVPAAAADAPAPDDGVARWVRRGDHWDVAWRGRSVLLRHGKGMADLARLLSVPGQEVHCLDLAGAGAEEASTGEILDPEARRRYETRIRDLQAELDDAEDHNDLGRIERVQTEMDALVDQLSAALALHGQGRRAGGTAERARSAVTQRIRGTIRRISEQHPELGRHLERSVATGTWCAYRPEDPARWELG